MEVPTTNVTGEHERMHHLMADDITLVHKESITKSTLEKRSARVQEFVPNKVALVGKIDAAIITLEDRREGAAPNDLRPFLALLRDEGQLWPWPQSLPQMHMGVPDEGQLGGKGLLADVTLPALNSLVGELVLL